MNKLIISTVAMLAATQAWAQAPAPVKPLTPVEMQISALNARIASYHVNIMNFNAAATANQGLLTSDLLTLGNLCKAIPRPAGCPAK
jgi:hypothetical protein